MFSTTTKTIENILKTILLAALFISPLIYDASLYFPYTSGKAYFFRLMIQLALIPWIILLVKKPESRPKIKNPLIIALLAFTAVLIITSFTGVDPIHSFFSNIERSDGVIQYVHYVLYFLMAVSVFKTKKDWQIVLSFFLLAALINCIYGFGHYNEQPRLFGLLGNSSYLGGFLIFAIGFCLLFLVNSFKLFIKKTPIAYVFLVFGFVALFAVTLFFTQTRGAFGGIFLGFVIFVILTNFFLWKKNKKLIIFLNVLLLLAIVGSVSLFVLRESSFIKKYPIFYRIANTFRSNSAQDRLSEWNTALKGFKDKPLLGWGPENFDVVANKYYNYRVGLYEPWFDRPHNQALQYLVEGGIFLFAAYLFLIAAILYSIFKIYKKEKITASILLAIYVGYIVQSLILFDTLPLFLGIFTLFALIYFFSHSSLEASFPQKIKITTPLSIGTVVLTVIVATLIWLTAFIPYKGSQLIIDSFKAAAMKDYKNQNLILDKLFSFKSPYLYTDIRRALAWDFGRNVLDKEIKPEDKQEVINLFGRIVPEMENWVKYRPLDQQAYYTLGFSYRIGYEKFGRTEDLAKAEETFRRALTLSSSRVEYVDELGQALVLGNKFDELDKLMKDFASKIDPDDPYRYLSLGNSYFMQNKYDLAFEEYRKAKELGQKFWDSERDYYRYLKSAEMLKNYQSVLEMVWEQINGRGYDADNLFNLAVAYHYLGENQKAQEYFNKAAASNTEFEQYRNEFFK